MQLLLRQPGDAPVILLSREGITQVDLLFMVLYGITLFPIAEEIRNVDPTLLLPFYAEGAAFDGSERQSDEQLCLLMDQGPDWVYFSSPV